MLHGLTREPCARATWIAADGACAFACARLQAFPGFGCNSPGAKTPAETDNGVGGNCQKCVAGVCPEDCAEGLMNCGRGMCAIDKATCASAIANMIIAPIMMVSNLFTLGAFGKAKKAADTAGDVQKASRLTRLSNSFQDATDAVKSAIGLENVAKMNKAKELASEVAKTAGATLAAVNKAMEAAEENVDTLANPVAARALARYFKPTSPNYKLIAKNMGWISTALALAEMVKALALQAASFVDPTGIVDTIAAFAKKMCKQHTYGPMESLGLPLRTLVKGTLHHVTSCNQCNTGTNWCATATSTGTYANLGDRYDFDGENLAAWGCDKVTSSTKAVRQAGTPGIYVVEPYDLYPGDPFIVGTP